MDKFKINLLKDSLAEKFSMLTYLVATSMCVDNEDYLRYLVTELDGLITNLTDGEIIEGEI